jgi:sugar phosphate isomerase/epimerase
MISLAHLTAIQLPPPELIHLAARTGYDAVGLRLVRVTDSSPGYPLQREAQLLRATQAALADTGLAVLDIEFVRITPDFNAADFESVLAAGAEIGAHHVIAAPYDENIARLRDSLASLQERAERHGLSVVLEFFPWTPVPDLATALTVAEPVAGAGVLVDALHFDRSDSHWSDLTAAATRMPFLHLCDAPVAPPYDLDALLYAGRAERLPPGEGEIDLPALLAATPPDIPVALEVPMTALAAAEGYEAVALRAISAARRVLSEG